MSMVSTLEILAAIKEALELEAEPTIEDNIRTLEEWDSLGHLSILIKIDRLLGGKAAKIGELGKAESIKEIIDILASKGLVEN